MITHPGIKVGLNYHFNSWYNNSRLESFFVSLSTGFFYHRRYQNGYFLLPEINYERQSVNGNNFSTGLGFGYLRTTIPKTYEVNPSSGEVTKVKAGHNYFITNISVAFGKDLRDPAEISNSFYIKPQFMYAFPNFPRGVGYFNLEAGSNINLNPDE